MIIHPDQSRDPHLARLALSIFERKTVQDEEFRIILTEIPDLSEPEINAMLSLSIPDKNRSATALAGNIAFELGCLEECPDLFSVLKALM